MPSDLAPERTRLLRVEFWCETCGGSFVSLRVSPDELKAQQGSITHLVGMLARSHDCPGPVDLTCHTEH